MMDTNTEIVLTGVIVATGRWAENKSLNMGIVVGGGVAAIMLTLVAQANQSLADKMGLMILLAACFIYLPSIVNSLGFIGASDQTKGKRVGK